MSLGKTGAAFNGSATRSWHQAKRRQTNKSGRSIGGASFKDSYCHTLAAWSQPMSNIIITLPSDVNHAGHHYRTTSEAGP